jgi:hypothetical protein
VRALLAPGSANRPTTRSILWAVLLVAQLLAIMAVSETAPSAAGATTTGSGASPWVRDTVQSLDIFLPDANSDYYLDGFGTKNGARTIITGRVPHARYWSFTAYPPGSSGPVEHVHDTDITRSPRGRYRVTLSADCAGIRGTCLATTTAEPVGIVVLRLYVPIDLNGAGTGGVPLPSISYTSARGRPLSLTQAAGTPAIARVLAWYRAQHGALPSELTKSYPPDAPVPTPVVDPPPVGRISQGVGRFNNPDNIYEHIRFTTTRGNLVASAQAPTYQADSLPSTNNLGRPAATSPQVRYWSLCIVLTDLHTGACLRDAQVRFAPGSTRFTVIVSPTCPVAGYRNCLVAGPQPLQVSLAYRYLLPSKAFTPNVFKGPYRLTATYVGRPS